MVMTKPTSGTKHVSRWIKGYEGEYRITNRGVVISVERRVPVVRYGVKHYQFVPRRKLRTRCDKSGYLYATLVRRGIPKTIKVHRLVLESFKGPCPAGKQACHNNGKRRDNRIENLRWDTAKNNCKDKVRYGNQPLGEDCPQTKLTREQVRYIRRVYKRHCRGRFGSARLAGRFHVSQVLIQKIVQRRVWKWLK